MSHLDETSGRLTSVELPSLRYTTYDDTETAAYLKPCYPSVGAFLLPYYHGMFFYLIDVARPQLYLFLSYVTSSF